MRPIRKGPEPSQLTMHRLSGGSYSNFRDIPILRESLVNEQRGLCCYCMAGIAASGPVKIEHWRPQSKYPEMQLSYGNLLAACTGNERGGTPRHCDTSKKNGEISRNPANPEHAVDRFIRYEPDGHIASDDPNFHHDLDAVLNLNLPMLKNRRQATLDGFKDTLRKRGTLKRETLQRLLAEWNGDNLSRSLEPYCQVVVYWLRKRLDRR